MVALIGFRINGFKALFELGDFGFELRSKDNKPFVGEYECQFRR